MLAFFRIQQAVAGAVILPNGLGMLRYAAGNRAGVQFGLMGTVSGMAASAGPLIGSFLVPIDWRLTFGVNIPIVVLALILATANLPEEATRERPRTRFDVVGVVALGLLLMGTAWVLTSLGRGGPDVLAIVIAVSVAIGFVAFVRYENARDDPALPPSLFLIRSFTAANVAMCFSNLFHSPVLKSASNSPAVRMTISRGLSNNRSMRNSATRSPTPIPAAMSVLRVR